MILPQGPYWMNILLDSDVSFSGSGINPAVAASALIGRKEAVTDVSIKAGEAYAARILPCWIRVSRDYFVAGNENFRNGKTQSTIRKLGRRC